jgi:hypothetical protein
MTVTRVFTESKQSQLDKRVFGKYRKVFEIRSDHDEYRVKLTEGYLNHHPKTKLHHFRYVQILTERPGKREANRTSVFYKT